MILKKKHILWDWNGTILDDATLCWELFNQSLNDHGAPAITFAEYKEIYQHPVQSMYEAAGIDFSVVCQRSLFAGWMQRYSDNFREVALRVARCCYKTLC